MTLIVNSSDDWDDGDNPLTVKGTVDIAGPKITYKLFDDKNNDGVWSAGEAEFEVVVPFDNIKFNVEYKKDIKLIQKNLAKAPGCVSRSFHFLKLKIKM